MDVVLIPGNHDAVRQALPQPAITKDFAGPVYDSRKVVSLGDPAEVRLESVDFLLFHGTSLMDILSSAPGFDYQRPVEVMEYQLRARHLAPEYGKSTPIGPELEDWLWWNMSRTCSSQDMSMCRDREFIVGRRS